MTTIAKVRGIDGLTSLQLQALVRTAETLNIDPDWLATVMAFETGGSFSPSVRNAAGSGAFGLIQFMPSTARGILKTATNEEAVRIGTAMSFEDQLEQMVIPYFRGRTMHNLNDVYLQVFYPAAAGKADDYVVGASPSAVYRQNQGFDREGKGYITRGDITRTINSVLQAAGGVRIPVGNDSFLGKTTNNTGQVIVGLAVSAGMYAFYHRYLKTGLLADIVRKKLPRIV